MESSDSLLEENRKELPPEEELRHFKGVVKSRLMQDASKVLAELEVEVSGPEAERLIELLDHYLSYTERFCEG